MLKLKQTTGGGGRKQQKTKTKRIKTQEVSNEPPRSPQPQSPRIDLIDGQGTHDFLSESQRPTTAEAGKNRVVAAVKVVQKRKTPV